MHQHPRPSPRSSTPATNPTTNPERTNNSREQPPTRNRSSVDLTAYTERAAAEASTAARPEAGPSGVQDKETVRLNQIIQQFHTKSALMICGARSHLPPAYAKTGEKRQNRWFNIIVDETDVLVNDVQEWKRPDLHSERPPPLVIEVYLDTSHMPSNQALLCVDDEGRQREVVPAREGSSVSSRNGRRYREIVLERWTIELGDPASSSANDLREALPSVYKKGIVALRTLYSTLRMLPAWKLYRQLGRQPGNNHPLRLKFRIRPAHEINHPPDSDPLSTPLFSSPAARTSHDRHPTVTSDTTSSASNHDRSLDGVGGGLLHQQLQLRGARRGGAPAATASQALADLQTPAGPLRLRVDFRRSVDFACADGESVLSAALLSGEQRAFTTLTGRSLPGERTEAQRESDGIRQAAATTSRDRPRGLFGAYGSLGTFTSSTQHSSPTTAELRQLRLPSDAEYDDNDTSDSMNRRNALRDAAGASPITPPPGYFKNGPMNPSPSPRQRATPPSQQASSSSFTPASPRPLPHPSPRPSPRPIHPPSSSPQPGRPGALPQQQLRNPTTTDTAVGSSASSSPKPATGRYSSSFANRPRRWTSQSSKAAESNASSGRGSSDNSKEKLSHGSASAKTDDDSDIASFLKDLDVSKDIKFVTPPSSSSRGGSGGNIINLAKYSSMRNDSTALADEMSSSSLIQASSTPPSRRLSNVPGLSISSSPSRVQPHAPHVRSRLSTHSIVEEGVAAASANSGGGSGGLEEEREEEDDDLPFIFQAEL